MCNFYVVYTRLTEIMHLFTFVFTETSDDDDDDD